MVENRVIDPEKEPEKKIAINWSEILIEAVKGIKNEILIYALVVALLLVSASSFGLDVIRELKWPLLFIFTLGLVAYFLARAVPQARRRLIRKQKQS